jgi:hypothetical protein
MRTPVTQESIALNISIPRTSLTLVTSSERSSMPAPETGEDAHHAPGLLTPGERFQLDIRKPGEIVMLPLVHDAPGVLVPQEATRTI